MKEIGIEKLIELLNEYEETKIHIGEKGVWRNNMVWKDGKFRPVSDRYPSNYMTQYYLISKEYGFIKWLVDNDKIDRESENYPLKKYYPYFNDDVLAIVSQDCNTYEDECRVCYDKYESLLMLLAIQENPIEFLCSVLK